jgi:hypothetical protein
VNSAANDQTVQEERRYRGFMSWRGSGELPRWEMEKIGSPRESTDRLCLSCFPSAEEITIIPVVAIHAGETARKNQSQHEAFEFAFRSMAVDVMAATQWALADGNPRLPHFRHVAQWLRGLNCASTK